LVSAVDIIYHFEGNDPMLLSIASKQNRVMLDDTGLSVAEAVTKGRAIPFVKKSLELKDGSKGDEGAVGIIRSGETEDELCLVMKYSAQGMGHGHFDKLSFSLYDKGAEVFQDYGAARYVNIDQKFGGAYLPENSSWAKQTIAHNTMVVNEKSHFEGNTEIGDKYHSDPILFDAGSKNILVMSAKEDNAYPGVQMNRSMVVVKDDSFEKPLVIDVYRVNSESKNQYDLPWHFVGQVMNTSFKYAVPQILSPLGSASGYQHLWKTGEGTSTNKNAKLSWFNNERFYTLTTLVAPEDQLLFARLGAKDPEFNLRPDPAFIIRKKQQKNAVFVSVIESHGHYDPINEIASNSNSRVTNLDLTYHNEKYSVITWVYNTNTSWTLLLSNGDTTSKSTHHLECSGKRYDWTGPYNLIKN
jgi:hypothetical protein